MLEHIEHRSNTARQVSSIYRASIGHNIHRASLRLNQVDHQQFSQSRHHRSSRPKASSAFGLRFKQAGQQPSFQPRRIPNLGFNRQRSPTPVSARKGHRPSSQTILVFSIHVDQICHQSPFQSKRSPTFASTLEDNQPSFQPKHHQPGLQSKPDTRSTVVGVMGGGTRRLRPSTQNKVHFGTDREFTSSGCPNEEL